MDSSHVVLSSQESSLSSDSQKTTVSRSQSDTSTISSKSDRPASKANISVDNIPTKAHQLLKLSFLNSPNSPLHHSSFNQTSKADKALIEARKIALQFADARDLSFEDLNNISQQLIDSSDLSITDVDLLAMKVKIVNKNRSGPPSPSSDKIAMLNEQLMRIKQEKNPDDVPVKIKVEKSDDDVKVKSVIKKEKEEVKNVPIIIEPTPEVIVIDDCQASGDKPASELDGLLDNLKSMINDGNKDAARKQLQRLNDMIGKQKESNEAKNTLHVQPVVRQDTFEIDEGTGKKKYKPNTEPTQKTENEDLIEKLAKLLGAQSFDFRSLNLGGGDSGAKVVVVVPSHAATPAKKQKEAPATSLHAKSALKAIDPKRAATPLKRLTHGNRPSTFVTPRPMTASKAQPYEHKTATQPRVSSVRKSLIGAIEKSPQVQKPKVSSTTGPRVSLVRRSVSMKASIPSNQPSKSSPAKTVPRPSTGAPYMSSATSQRRDSHIAGTPVRPSTSARSIPASRARTLSEKKPVSQFKAPSAIRKAAADPKGSLV